MDAIRTLAIIGFLLSVYALYVTWRSKQNHNYTPFCDINDRISCTKALTSKYDALLVLPNSVYGLLFYAFVFFVTDARILVLFSLLAVCASVVLAYISYVKLRTLCVVCTSTYLVNIALLVLSLRASGVF